MANNKKHNKASHAKPQLLRSFGPCLQLSIYLLLVRKTPRIVLAAIYAYLSKFLNHEGQPQYLVVALFAKKVVITAMYLEENASDNSRSRL